MEPDLETYDALLEELRPYHATLVAVSKTKPADMIRKVYDHGHRDFGENYVQELVNKQPVLPPDVRWHFIGHLQSNKVKQVVPFIHLLHGTDSPALIREIGKQAVKINRTVDVLLQVHIASESTKFGMTQREAESFGETWTGQPVPGVVIRGLMGMASFTDDQRLVRDEFRSLKKLFDRMRTVMGSSFDVLSMGMSGDYKIALEEGSTLVRIGSAIFGER